MSMVHGYEGYKVNFIRSNFFYNYATERYLLDLSYENNSYFLKSDSVIRIPDKTKKVWNNLGYLNASKIKEYPEISTHMCIPKSGEVLYYHKGCTIPRIRCSEKWKRTIKLEWADVVVIPEPIDVHMNSITSIFLSDKSKTVYLCMSTHNLSRYPSIGQTAEELYLLTTRDYSLNPNLVKNYDKEAWADFKNAKCVYFGAVFIFSPKDRYMMDIIDGVYPRIIFEKDLIKALDNEDERFDYDTMISIRDLLLSGDKASVVQGMRTLANLDFSRYPSIVKYILYNTRRNWKRFAPFNSAVKFMFKAINYNDVNSINQFKSVTPYEYDLAKTIMETEIRDQINATINCIKSYTNVVVDVDYSVSLSFGDNKIK